MKTKNLIALLAGVVLLAACKGKNYQADGSTAENLSLPQVDTVDNSPKIIKTAQIGFKVKNVQQSSDKVTALTALYKGTITHHQTTSSVDRSSSVRISEDSIMKVSAINTSCEITAKIPSAKLDEYMSQVSKMGIYVNLRRLDLEDKSLDYLSSQLRVKGRKEFLDQQKNKKAIIKNPADVLLLKDDLIDEQINNRKIDDAVKYSVVTLNFYQSNTILKEVIANDDTSTYNIPFFKRLALAFANGWYVFKEFILLLMNVWVFLAAGAIIWLMLRNYKKRIVLKATS